MGQRHSRRRPCSECRRPVVARKPPHSKGRTGIHKPGPDHDLCERCWRAIKNREFAARAAVDRI